MSSPEEMQREIEELKRRLEEYQLIFDSMPIMFWYKDTQNRHIRVNKAAAALESVPPSAIEGKTAWELYPKEQADAFHKDDLQVAESGKPKLNIIEKHTRPGTTENFWLQTGKVPFRDVNDKITGVIAFAVDITEQKKAEEAVREARDQMEQQNRRMTRVVEFFRSSLEVLTENFARGASHRDMLDLLNNARAEFEKLD